MKTKRYSSMIGAIVAIVGCNVMIVCGQESRNQLPKQQHQRSDAPFLKPAEAVKKMSIPNGFDVTVFAAEPDIAEPIAFCFDDRGRLWIAENFNYQTRSKHTTDPVSRIQILEDTDGDGVFDNKKTFTDKLTFTSGLACGFGGVFVGSPPNLTFIPDKNGDDVPDGPPQILLDGWGMDDRHETLNSFIWGPDGWLYGCHGVFTNSNVGTPGTANSNRVFIDGGIWRYHPTRKKFEVFARGLSNPWGFDFDEHGQGFATCCVIPHLFHVVQGGVYHKQSKPHINPYIYDDIKTIRDHTHLSAHGGARFYLADAFPSQYHKRLFMCNIHEHAVLTDFMEPAGSSFIGKHGDDFLPTNDLAWVGFSVEIGPEGAVYILDWHDQDVCGNAVKFPDSGRVYRVMPTGAKPIEQPNLGALSDSQLVQMQLHSNDWYVRQARTLLQYRAATGKLDTPLVHSMLEQILNDAPTSAKRLRALWALHVTNGLNGERLVELLDDQDKYVRAWTIQFLCEASETNAFQMDSETNWNLDDKVLEKLASMAQTDSSQVVRLYLASAVQRLTFEQRWPILKGLVSHSEDIADNNLPRMYWFGIEPMVPTHSKQTLQLVVEGDIPSLQEFVARRIATGNTSPAEFEATRKRRQWNKVITKVAPGFDIAAARDNDIVFEQSFRNATAARTHPIDRNTPCIISRSAKIPTSKQTQLKLRVSHHPHGDWQLRVIADGKLLVDRIISSKTVGPNEWCDIDVDLSRFAGKTIDLKIENRANDWYNEWAYWNRIEIVSE